MITGLFKKENKKTRLFETVESSYGLLSVLRLNGFLKFPGANTTGTNSHTSMGSVDNGIDSLQIGCNHALISVPSFGYYISG